MFGIENKKKEKAVESQIAQKQQLYKRVFDTVEGRLVMADLEKRCFVTRTTYSDNAGQMAFSEGRRSVYMFIKDLVDKDIQSIIEELTKG
jgi:hypothetical protein